jgi:branched-chain amino acid transport system substrate-binding protein
MRRFVSAACMLLALCGAAAALAADAPLIVGAALPQSGHLADLAADLRKSLLLWQEEVNAGGGLLGRRVELRLLDDASDAAAAGAFYERLVSEEHADLLVGPMGSASTQGAANAAERHRRVLVNATGAARAAQKGGFRYVFQVPAPFSSYGSGALEIARSHGYRRIAIYARNDPASREMATRLRDEALAAGLQPGELDVYSIRASDFGAQIDKARSFQAQAWIAFGLARDAAAMVKSFRKHRYAPEMFVALGAAEPDFVRLVGQDAEHALGILPWDRTLATKENASFVAAYERRWSAEPTLVAAQAYAAAKVLEEAVRRAGALDQERLRSELQRLELRTPLGLYKAGQDGLQAAARPLVTQIQRGRRQVVWPEALATAKVQLPYAARQERKAER